MKFEIVIGSWGSYNSKNDRSLGSGWIDLSEYDNWSDIEEELKKQGFQLDGIDEELFIQDMNFKIDGFSGDYTHPKLLFNILKNSGALKDEHKAKEMLAYLEIETWEEFCDLVEEKGEEWDDGFYFDEDASGADWAYAQLEESLGKDTFRWLSNYIDFDKYAEDSNIKETSYGVIEFIE